MLTWSCVVAEKTWHRGKSLVLESGDPPHGVALDQIPFLSGPHTSSIVCSLDQTFSKRFPWNREVCGGNAGTFKPCTASI